MTLALPIHRIVRELLGWHLGSEPLLVVEFEDGVVAYDGTDLKLLAAQGEGWAQAYSARLERLVEAYLVERGV